MISKTIDQMSLTTMESDIESSGSVKLCENDADDAPNQTERTSQHALCNRNIPEHNPVRTLRTGSWSLDFQEVFEYWVKGTPQSFQQSDTERDVTERFFPLSRRRNQQSQHNNLFREMFLAESITGKGLLVCPTCSGLGYIRPSQIEEMEKTTDFAEKENVPESEPLDVMCGESVSPVQSLGPSYKKDVCDSLDPAPTMYSPDAASKKHSPNSAPRRHSSGSGASLTRKQVECAECKAKFSSEDALARHTDTFAENEHMRIFKCFHCSHAFCSKGERNMHERTFHRLLPFPCCCCGSKFPSRNALVLHTMRNKVPSPLVCPTCTAVFARKRYLMRHLRTVVKNLPFGCSICRHKFSTKLSLQRHERIHFQKMEFECASCFARFTEKRLLTKHLFYRISDAEEDKGSD